LLTGGGFGSRVAIPRLRGDDEVTVTVGIAQFVVVGADYVASTAYPDPDDPGRQLLVGQPQCPANTVETAWWDDG
jgi:hypothetical protein